MEETLNRKYLLMILYLMNHYSNLRQSVSDDTLVLKACYPEIIKSINSEIEKNCEIDLSKLESEDDFLKVEKYLGSLMNRYLEDYLSSSIEDETFLLKESLEIRKEQLSRAEIGIDKELKAILHAIKIRISGLESWLLTPDNVRYFKIGQNENVLCTRVIHIGNTKRLLFYHMGIKRLQSGFINQYHLFSAFSLDYVKFEDMKDSPIRLFLYLLDTYGIDLNCSSKTKKLFFKEKVGKELNVELLGKSRNIFTCFQEFFIDKERYISFLYAIDIHRYLGDFKRYQI